MRMTSVNERNALWAILAVALLAIDQNLFDLVKAGRTDRVSKTRVMKTVFEGKVVYDALHRDDK